MNLKKFSKFVKQIETDVKQMKKEAGVTDDDTDENSDDQDQNLPDDGESKSPKNSKKTKNSDDTDNSSFAPKQNDDGADTQADSGDDSKPFGKVKDEGKSKNSKKQSGGNDIPDDSEEDPEDESADSGDQDGKENPFQKKSDGSDEDDSEDNAEGSSEEDQEEQEPGDDELEDEKDDDDNIDIGPVEGPNTMSGKPKDKIVVNPDLDDKETNDKDESAPQKTKADATGDGNTNSPTKSKTTTSGEDKDVSDENDEKSDTSTKGKGVETLKGKDNDKASSTSGTKQADNSAGDDKLKKKDKKKPMKEAVITFGRMNPPTIGHEMLVNKMKTIAEESGSTVIIFLSHTSGNSDNPLSYHEKVEYAKKAFGDVIYEGTDASNIIKALQVVSKDYDAVTLVVGEDRFEEMRRIADNYNGKEFTLEHINIINAGKRAGTELIENVSAAKLRTYASTNSLNEVRDFLPENLKPIAEEIMNKVKPKYRSMADTLRDLGLSNVDI